MNLDDLDRYITGGRYSSNPIRVLCGACEQHVPVVAETEYGATTWSPEECPECGHPFDGEEKWEDDEPPEPEPPDDWGPPRLSMYADREFDR